MAYTEGNLLQTAARGSWARKLRTADDQSPTLFEGDTISSERRKVQVAEGGHQGAHRGYPLTDGSEGLIGEGVTNGRWPEPDPI